ncbi:MAG: cupin domain-containing protein [Rickettsiales bacterium]|nr:cupin domain-containing protein [Rickettsiales bacterium]
MFKYKVIILAFALLVSCSKNPPIMITKLKQSSQSWDGSKFSYPDKNEEITAIKIFLAPNAKLPYHCHPFPTIGFVLSGEVEVEKTNGEKHLFRKGDVVYELVNQWHRGRNPSKIKNTEIIAFYIGQTKSKNTILFDKNNSQCH